MLTPHEERLDRLERRVESLTGQVQALAALTALRIGSLRLLSGAEPGAEFPPVFGAWETALATQQCEGLRHFVEHNEQAALAEGLEGILTLVATSLDELRGSSRDDGGLA